MELVYEVRRNFYCSCKEAYQAGISLNLNGRCVSLQKEIFFRFFFFPPILIAWFVCQMFNM